MLYADVIVPAPLDATFTYRVPDHLVMAVNVGQRIIVPFGAKRFVTGIVKSLMPVVTTKFEIKDIAVVLDDKPIVRHPQLKLWNWIADYYMAPIGDVMKAALPAGLKIESETFVEPNPDLPLEEILPSLSDRELIITETLMQRGAMTVISIEKETKLTNLTRTVNDMVDKGYIIISEKVVERYRSVKIKYVRLKIRDDERDAAFKSLSRSIAQTNALLALIEMSKPQPGSNEPTEVRQDDLIKRAAVTTQNIRALEEKGLIERYVKEVNRFKFDLDGVASLPTLTDEQSEALKSIIKQWAERSTVLLHGVTSSGKTEIYSHLIERYLAGGYQVLYLVPEIALTTQLTSRLQRVFGNRVVVYHSKFTDNERVDIWKKMLHDPHPWVIVGARSALFLPFSRLGLVIVDEEHDPSYKQSDPAPRYNGRDVAMVLASMHGAKTLLGSATPAVETYYKALSGKFGLVTLLKRFNDLPLPPVSIIDMTTARKKGEIVGPLSTNSIRLVNDALANSRQAILFRNRRGYAPIARCRQCAWIPKCDNCDVTLTYHQHSNRLVCHYCGAQYPLPELCPQCQQPAVETLGYGTERVEQEVESMFAPYKTVRMDLDTTRSKENYETIVERFSQHKADILVGTQMVTKGLDFKDVSTVVVLNADELINYPDFKASERAFNMLEQVAGRAGRHEAASTDVLIQTYQPDNFIFPFVCDHNYQGFYNTVIDERRQFNYPPFTHIIYIYLKHRDSATLRAFSSTYADRLRHQLGNRVQGPDQPRIARVKSLFIQKIMIKVEANASMVEVRRILRETYRLMASDPTIRNTEIYYDVDP